MNKNVSKKIFLTFFYLLFVTDCAKRMNLSNNPPDETQSYIIYKEGLDAMNNSEFFFAAQKFSEAENILPVVEHSAKALLMKSCFYTINFFDETISSLENFLRKYPADENVEYASYLMVLSNYEQILDEKDLKTVTTYKKIS